MKSLLNKIWKIVTVLLVLVCVVLIVLKAFGVSVIFVKGDSMEPTYKSGELHLIAEASEYERGDVVAVRVDDMTILKRIIAIEGDVLEIYHHCIFVNDGLVTPYIKGENWNDSGEFDKCLTIDEDECFLLGDDRNRSADSRHSEIGTIKTEQILGRIIQ